jgi:hypothetical protein
MRFSVIEKLKFIETAEVSSAPASVVMLKIFLERAAPAITVLPSVL